MKRLRDLPGLGPKSEVWLTEVGISSPDKLREMGAVRAFIRLQNECSSKPGLNCLYAMIGAIEGENWLKIAKHEKSRLLAELEGYQELEALFKAEGTATTPP